MIKHLQRIFGPGAAPIGALASREPLEIATAALLIELARSDFSESPAEAAAIRQILQRKFDMGEPKLNEVIADARQRADRAVSLHEFTHQLNKELSEAEKIGIVEMLWQVSNADGRIDKHEEYLVLRVAGLLHVSDRDRVRMKLKTVMKGSQDGD